MDQFSDALQSMIKNILLNGYIYEGGKLYDFRHSIIIISTLVGSEHIIRLVQSMPEEHKQIDLMQLVLNEHITTTVNPYNQRGFQEQMIENILPELTEKFSNDIMSSVNLIPFFPLTFIALEKIIQHKMQLLKKRLETLYNIELQYASEIIQFLAHETLWSKRVFIKSLDKILEYYLYSCVSYTILRHMDHKSSSHGRILLQLNENGQSLKCDFVAVNEAVFI